MVLVVKDNDAPLLLDVSRMVWRRWAGTRATGIDRICQAWIEHYGSRAQAVIIHRHGQAILPFQTSQKLFRLLTLPERARSDVVRFRMALGALAVRRGVHLRDRLDGRGRFWLNPGHTGLDRLGLAEWVQRRNLRPIHLIHDLIPITHPQFCREGEDERHRRRMRAALDTASGVIANSAHTLDTLREFAAVEGRTLPPATVAWPGTPALPSLPPQPDREPTFVILGTIEGRKNQALLLAAWRQLLGDEGIAAKPRLLIVGRRGWQADDVFAELDSGAFGDSVVELGPLDDDRLAEVLARTRALLFPSITEGYGIPLVEALAARVPVIANDLPVFREIGQGVPELLPADDLTAWKDAICDYAKDQSPRRSAQMARIEGFHVPDWTEHFSQVDALLELLRRHD